MSNTDISNVTDIALRGYNFSSSILRPIIIPRLKIEMLKFQRVKPLYLWVMAQDDDVYVQKTDSLIWCYFTLAH